MDDPDIDQFIERLCDTAGEDIELLVDQFIIRHANQRVIDSSPGSEAFNRDVRVKIFKLLAETRNSNGTENGSNNDGDS